MEYIIFLYPINIKCWVDSGKWLYDFVNVVQKQNKNAFALQGLLE